MIGGHIGFAGGVLLVAALGAFASCTSSSGGGAPVPNVDAAVSPCASAHAFCDDFDQGALGARWDDRNVTGGPLDVDDASFRSPPFAFRARSPAQAAARSVVLYKKLPDPSAGKLRCELDVLLRQRAGGAADVFELRLSADPAGTFYYAYLQATDAGTLVGQELAFPDGGKTTSLNAVTDVQNGAWHHLRFDTDWKTISFAFDGQPAHVETMSLATGTAPQLAVGLVYTEGGGPFDFLFDDVACDTVP